jgi:transcriptional regulator with XRE-family HTH domain
MESYMIIKRLLERRKLEQADLAAALGVSSKTAHNYLNGHTKITIDQIPAIVKLLRVPYDILFQFKELNILQEPIENYEVSTDYKLLCKQKDQTIEAQRETIATLKGQIDFLKNQLEK